MNSIWSYSPETPNVGQNRRFFVPSVLEIWRMTLKNNRAPLLCCFKLCASFHNHWWIQTGVTVQKHPIWVKIDDFLLSVSVLEIWRMTLKNNTAPLLSNSKLRASFHHHMWIQNSNWSYSPETAKWSHDLCDLDLWPWPLAWTLLLSMVITPEYFMVIRWQEHSEKGVTDRQTDRRTDRRTEISVFRAAWSQLKTMGGYEQYRHLAD